MARKMKFGDEIGEFKFFYVNAGMVHSEMFGKVDRPFARNIVGNRNTLNSHSLQDGGEDVIRVGVAV